MRVVKGGTREATERCKRQGASAETTTRRDAGDRARDRGAAACMSMQRPRKRRTGGCSIGAAGCSGSSRCSSAACRWASARCRCCSSQARRCRCRQPSLGACPSGAWEPCRPSAHRLALTQAGTRDERSDSLNACIAACTAAAAAAAVAAVRRRRHS
eukprot:2485502-Pleurochrysis_carterae.AAC.2